MARKRLTRDESRLHTRERLLEAATEVFSRRGFEAASVDEIADEAGFSKGAVYSNFASKEELFLTLLDRHLWNELQSMMMQFTVPKEAAPDVEKITVDAKESEQREESPHPQTFKEALQKKRTENILTLEFFLYAMRHPEAQQQLAERYRGGRQEITKVLQTLLNEHGGQAGFPIEYMSWSLIALGLGLALQAYLEPVALPDDLYKTISAQLLKALLQE
ncbi:TetR family transcriptional regulator [Ktedonobacteria bacterium brp13]|nr:TetR family transcriptional regulator [Ktedonobacteria bacterium brp13]